MYRIATLFQLSRRCSVSQAVNAGSARIASSASLADGTDGWSTTLTDSRAVIGATGGVAVKSRMGLPMSRPTYGKPTETS